MEPIEEAKGVWNMNGNAGTNANNFIGTTDNEPLHFKVNNIPAGIINPNGSIGLGRGALGKNILSPGLVAIGDSALY